MRDYKPIQLEYFFSRPPEGIATLVPHKAIYPMDLPITVSLKTPSQRHTHLGRRKSIYSDEGSQLYKLLLIQLPHQCLRRVVTKVGFEIPKKRFIYANFVTSVLEVKRLLGPNGQNYKCRHDHRPRNLHKVTLVSFWASPVYDSQTMAQVPESLEYFHDGWKFFTINFTTVVVAE